MKAGRISLDRRSHSAIRRNPIPFERGVRHFRRLHCPAFVGWLVRYPGTSLNRGIMLSTLAVYGAPTVFATVHRSPVGTGCIPPRSNRSLPSHRTYGLRFSVLLPMTIVAVATDPSRSDDPAKILNFLVDFSSSHHHDRLPAKYSR